MKTATASRFRRWMKLLPLGATLVATTVMSGQQAQPLGVPDDWSHHRVVFSNPGSAAEAIQKGTYAQWAKIVSDPRWALQQRKRGAAAAAGLNPMLPPPEAETVALPDEMETPKGSDLPQNRHVRGLTPAIPNGEGTEGPRGGREPRDRGPHHGHRFGKNGLHTDWSVNLGGGATSGLGTYPAKYSFSISSANCASATTPDYAVYNTGLAGSGMMGSTQASIVAFDNLYTGCTGTVPTVYWAYDTNGGAIMTSVLLSLDGSQLAFVQSTASVASLVVLKWAASTTESASAPDVLPNTAASSYRSCPAPCMTAIPFSNGANDSGSSVYYDYGTDVLYVGDDSGELHKFTGVFAGTPAEAGGVWPVSVNASGEGLSSPVIDPGTGKVLVGDYLVSGTTNCATAGCGFLYAVNPTTGAVVQSARLDYIFGIVDGPIVDAAAEQAYVFVGADSGFLSAASPCGVRVACSGVFQFPTNFTSGAAGTEAQIGDGYDFLLDGTFDNKYLTSGTATGNLYVVGNTGTANNTLYQIPISAGTMGSSKAGPALSTNYTDGYMAAGMSITEIYTGTKDYIFTSVLVFAAPAACTSSLTEGCVMGFDVTSGTISSATLPTGATTEAGGTSAIVIDTATNGLAGTSNIYYTPLADQLCASGGTGGCAIQISQASP
jgi:hypothetical protein